jgi:single-stranded DNA-binding protein
VIVFGARADVAAELTIGQPVRKGRLSQREWMAPDGKTRRTHRIVADRSWRLRHR